MFYLYGIAKTKRDSLLAVPGIGGAPVQMMSWRGLAVAASPIGTWEVAVNESNIRCHERVVEAVMATATVLPLRFGTVVDDAHAFRRRFSQDYRLLTERLELVAGRVEFGLRLSGNILHESPPGAGECPDAAGGPGTAYLRSLARSCSNWPTRLAGSLRRAFAPWAVTSVLWPRDTASPELRASFLVGRGDIDAFRQGVADFRAGQPDLLVSCTGPWPPYSFVGDAFPRDSDGEEDHEKA